MQLPVQLTGAHVAITWLYTTKPYSLKMPRRDLK